MNYLKLKDQNASVDFKKYKSTLDRLYSDERTVSQIVGKRLAYSNPAKAQSRDELTKSFIANLSNPNEAGQVSETLVSINGIYAEIIRYYVTMPLYRYTVVPEKVKKLRETGAEEKYSEVYEKMLSVVDGISLEVILPKILQNGLIYGIIYMYIDKDQSSETVETFMLPNLYCRKGFATNFGTDTITFDFKFFDDIRTKLRSSSNGLEIEEDDLFELFPAALVQQYKKYLKDKNLRWQELDPKFGAAISFSPNSMPPKLYANYGIIDYEVLRRNEVTRSNNELEKILVHQIPHTSEGNLMFEIEEALELHDSMAKALSGGVKGLKLLTTFGDTELIELQEQRAKDSQVVQQTFGSIFQSAGINPEIFVGDSKEALQYSTMKDAGYVFTIKFSYQSLQPLAINNLYFNPYQANIKLLPITIYDETEKVNMYLESATFGIGKLEAVVAAGIKQKDIYDKHVLEKYLDLDNILVPLQSAHTSSGKDQPVKEEEPKDDGEETVEVDEENEEST